MIRIFLLLAAALLWSGAAVAAPIQFVYAGANGDDTANGVFTMDDSLFNGSSMQSISHSTISAFTFTVDDGSDSSTWELTDLITTSSFFFDSSGSTPDIVGASGVSATNGLGDLVFASTGSVNSPLVFLNDTQGVWTFVPEPSSVLLLGAGLLGLASRRRRSPARSGR